MVPKFSIFRSYSGGPNYDRLRTVFFDLEGIALELTHPDTLRARPDAPRPLNIPFKMAGWYEANRKNADTDFNDQAHIYSELWSYHPVRLARLVNLLSMGTNEAVSSLCIAANIKRLKKGRRLDLSNENSLCDYIKWDYDDYYETPPLGNFAKGANFETRKKFDEYLKEHGEWYREQYNAGLNNELLAMPENYQLCDINQKAWTLFQLKSHKSRIAQFYNIPLSEQYYLQIVIDMYFYDQNFVEKVKPDMLRTAEWLAQNFKVTFPGQNTLPPPRS